MKFFITGIRRGLGKALVDKYGNCNSLEECDIFINCKHDGFLQVDLLYKAADLNKRIITIIKPIIMGIPILGSLSILKKNLSLRYSEIFRINCLIS